MFNLAIIGTGNISGEHVAAYRKLHKYYRIVAFCDTKIKLAQQAAAKINNCTAYKDYAPILANPEIDIVDICLPPPLHAPVTIAALKAGKHVICEKPLASTIADARQMATVAKKTGKVLMPIFQYRYGRACQQLLALHQHNLTGKPYVASIETHWNRNKEYYSKTPWRKYQGAVLNHVIHAHDLVATLFGKYVSVSANLATRVNKIYSEDCVAVIMETANGGLVSSSTTLGAATDSSRLRLVFEKLTVESSSRPYDHGIANWKFIARDKSLQKKIDSTIAKVTTPNSSFAGQFYALAQHLTGHPANLVTPAEGIHAIETAVAIHTAAKLGKKLTWPLPQKLAKVSY